MTTPRLLGGSTCPEPHAHAHEEEQQSPPWAAAGRARGEEDQPSAEVGARGRAAPLLLDVERVPASAKVPNIPSLQTHKCHHLLT